MNTSLVPDAVSIDVSDDTLTVNLSDGRTITVPIDWFPRLVHATQDERDNWRLIGSGEGIHWPDLDEDINIKNLLTGKKSGESQASLSRWLKARNRMVNADENLEEG